MTDAGAGASASFQCTSCPLVCRNPGALATHAVACRRKRKLQEAALAAGVQATEFQQRTRDEQGRKLWTTDHNDICETCYGTGELLLCSYCNTAWHLHCTPEMFLEAPTGHWMCSMYVQAERDGENMMEHGLDDEDNAEGGAYDPSAIDADDEEGETDISQVAYENAGILPYPPNIFDASTQAALARALEPHALPPATHATTADKMLNVLRSRHALSLSVMVAFDEILWFIQENPDEKVTPARQRTKDLTEELQKCAPIVRYEVSDALISSRHN